MQKHGDSKFRGEPATFVKPPHSLTWYKYTVLGEFSVRRVWVRTPNLDVTFLVVKCIATLFLMRSVTIIFRYETLHCAAFYNFTFRSFLPLFVRFCFISFYCFIMFIAKYYFLVKKFIFFLLESINHSVMKICHPVKITNLNLYDHEHFLFEENSFSGFHFCHC